MVAICLNGLTTSSGLIPQNSKLKTKIDHHFYFKVINSRNKTDESLDLDLLIFPVMDGVPINIG